MAKRGTKDVTLTVGFDVDTSSLDTLRKDLADLAYISKNDAIKLGINLSPEDLRETKSKISDIEQALKKAYNPKLDAINIKKFNQELEKSELDLKDLYGSLSQMGPAGESAFYRLNAQLIKSGRELKKTKTLIDSLGETLVNTIKWNVASSAINAVTGSVQKAVGYVRSLDNSLNDIRIVTGASADEMDKFAVRANKAAKALGRATVDYTDASLLFYQQGLNDTEVQARTDLTMKVANTSGLGTEESAEYVTAVLSGYKVAVDDAEKSMDVLSKVGAETASSLAELSEGMAKVASSANAMGVSQEQLASTLATVISVTRQDASVVGTAFKTIYARISDIEAGAADAEVSLGEYTSKMKEMGFNVLDATGHLRDTGEVIEEIGYKWSDLTREQQVSLAQTMAGTRQYNNLIALFDNWDAYVTTLGKANAAEGTLQEQQEVYMDSIQAKLNALTTSVEKLYGTILDDDAFKTMIEGMAGLITIITNAIEALGGFGPVLTLVAGLMAKVFSKQIASNASNMVSAIKSVREYDKTAKDPRTIAAKETAKATGDEGYAQSTMNLIRAERYGNEEERKRAQKRYDDVSNNRAAIGASVSNAQSKVSFLRTFDHNAAEDLSGYIRETQNEVKNNILKSVARGEYNGETSSAYNAAALGRRDRANLKLQDLDNTFQILSERDIGADKDKIRTLAKGASATKSLSSKALSQIEADLNKDFDDTNIPDSIKDLLDKKDKIIEKVRKEIKAITGEVENIDLTNSQGTITRAAQGLNDDVVNNKDDDERFKRAEELEDVSNALGALTQVGTGAVMMFNSLKATTDENLTAFEKLSALLTGGLMGFQMISSNLKAAKDGLSVIGNYANKFIGPMVSKLSGGAAATSTLKTSLLSLIKVPFVPWATAAIAILGGLAFATYKLSKAEEDALKVSEERLKASESALSAAKEEQEQLNSSLSTYESQRDAISGLIVGSADWETATRNLSSSVDELMQKYPQLAAELQESGDITFDANIGSLVLSDEAIERFKQEANNRIRDIEIETDTAKKSVIEDRQAVNWKNLTDRFATTSSQSISGYSNLIKETFSEMSSEAANNVFKDLDSIAGSVFQGSSFDELSDSNKDLIKSLYNNQSVVKDQIRETENNSKELNALSKKIGGGFMEKSENQSQLEGYTTGSDQAKEYMNYLVGNVTANEWETQLYKSKSKEDILTEYLAMRGYDSSYQLKQNDDDEYEVVDYEGKIVENLGGITVSAMREYLARNMAREKYVASDEAQAQLDNFREIESRVSQEFGDINAGEIMDAIAAIARSEGYDLSKSGISDEALTAMTQSEGFVNELVDKLGVTKEDFLGIFNEKNIEKTTKQREENRKTNIKNLKEGYARDLGITADAFEDFIETVKDYPGISDELKNDEEAMAAFAKRCYKTQEQMRELTKDVKDNKDALAAWVKGGTASSEIYDIIKKIQEAFKEASGVMLDTDAIKENWDSVILPYLNGDRSEEIIAELGRITGEKAKADIQVELDGIEDADEKLNAFLNYAEKLDPITLYSMLNDEDFRKSLEEMIASSNYSAKEIQKIFGNMGGFEFDVITKKVPFVESIATAPINLGMPGQGQYASTQKIDTKTVEVFAGLKPKGTSTSDIESSFRTPSTYSDKNKNSGGSKQKDTKDNLEDEKDVYHDINIELEKYNKEMSKLEKAQEKAFGKDLINNLKQQLNLLEKQRNAYARKLDIAKQDLATQRTLLSEYGAKFNADGQLSNYASLMDAELKRVNDAINHYNGLTADGQTDAEKEKLEAAEKRYAKVKELIDKYDNIINTIIPDIEESIEDALYKEIEINIEKFNLDITISLDLSQAKRDWNEFRRRVLEDYDDDNLVGQATKILRDMGAYYEEDVTSGTKKLQDILKELKTMDNGGLSSVYSAVDENTGVTVNDRKKALEDLKSTLDTVTDGLIELENLEDSVEETFLSSIDAISEAYDKQAENYEFFNGVLEHSIKLTELLYGDDAYAQMDKYYQEQSIMDKARVGALKEQSEYWRKMMETAKAEGDEEAYKKYLENWKGSIQELNSMIETWANNAVKKYENTISKIFSDLNKFISGGLGLDYVNEELSLLQMNSENYLDAVNASFELQSLAAKWQESINNTDSVESQKELNNLMAKQLKQLREKGALTQRDIDRAEKEYQIALKQIALRDAEQNKSQMRLRRDANGNYSYQFVADTDEVEKRQQELLAAQKELYNFDKDAYNNNLNEMYTIWNDFQQKTQETFIRYKDNETERERQLQLLREEYGQKINFLTEENGLIRQQLNQTQFDTLALMYGEDLVKWQTAIGQEKTDLETSLAERMGLSVEHFTQLATKYDENAGAFKGMTDAEKLAIIGEEGLVPTWNSGVQSMVDTIVGEGGFLYVVDDFFIRLKNAANDFLLELQDIEDESKAAVEETEEYYKELTKKNQEAIDAAKDEANAIHNVRTEVQKLISDYGAAKAAAVEASEAAWGYWKDQQEIAKQKAEEENKAATSQAPAQTPAPAPSNNGSGGGAAKKDNSDKIEGVAAAIWIDGGYTSKWYNGNDRKSRLNEKGISQVQTYINQHGPNGDIYRKWRGRDLKGYYYGAFEKGGYTGNWQGAEGRPFLLHPEEMVLNKSDTENILKTVDLTKRIVEAMSNGALMNIAKSLVSVSGSPMLGGNPGDFVQQVHIEANFPNATKATEIENALNNLMNIASQRTNRNNR